MAGWFYLGGGREEGSSSSKQELDHQDKEENPNNNNNNTFSNNFTLQLPYRHQNQEIYNKGFELWPPNYYQHQQNLSNYASSSFGVGPSSRRSNFSDDPSYTSRSSLGGIGGVGFSFMRQSGSLGGGGGMNCQDCGNQAKKDCVYLRCRTCCKSRGFQCQTHVRSTWVPAAKRRERQQLLSSLQQQQHQPQQQQQQQQFREENPKRLREVVPASTTPLPTTTSGLEMEHFPQQVNSPAVFRCVRVSSMDDPDEQLAYQTSVHIGGHVFKGILYDRGPETRFTSAGESSSGGPQQLNLITQSATTSASGSVAVGLASTSIAGGSGGGGGVSSSVALIDPSSLYPAPLNAFIAGTQFFPPPRS